MAKRCIMGWLVLLAASPAYGQEWSADLNCDGETNVTDVMLSILQALEMPVSEALDSDGNGIPDACQNQPLPVSACGSGTELAPDGQTCVVAQATLDQAYSEGLLDGAVPPPENVMLLCADSTYGSISWDSEAPGYAGSCTPWDTCSPGTFVYAEGTPTTNSTCAACVLGTGFTNEINASSCTPVTVCPPGSKESVPPTLISDRECEPVVVSLESVEAIVYEGGAISGSALLSINGPLSEGAHGSGGEQRECTPRNRCGSSGGRPGGDQRGLLPPGTTTVTLTVNPVVTPDLEPTETFSLSIEETGDYAIHPTQGEAHFTVYEHGPSPGNTLYVSETGQDSQEGSFEAPFKTIGYAVSQLTAGDTLFVMDGTYHNSGWAPAHGVDGTESIQNPILAQIAVEGTPEAWVRIAAYPDGNDTRPLLQFDGSGGIEFKTGTRYVLLEGLEIQGPNQEIQYDWAHEHRWSKENFYKGRGIFSWGPVDHIVVRDCHVHHTPGSGIRFNKADYILVENNRVANTTWWSSSAESAIVIATAQHIDELDAVKFLYSGNTVYNNWNFLEFCNTPLFGQTEDAYGNCDTYTGGIIDGQGLYVTRNNETYLHGRMRFENNITYNNGFGGVVYHKTDRGELVNNLVFMNGAYPGDTNYSGMTLNTADDVLIINNIIWARDSNDYGLKNNGNASNVTASHNLVAGKTQFGSTGDNTYLAFVDAPALDSVFAGASDTSWIHPDPMLLSGPLAPRKWEKRWILFFSTSHRFRTTHGLWMRVCCWIPRPSTVQGCPDLKAREPIRALTNGLPTKPDTLASGPSALGALEAHEYPSPPCSFSSVVRSSRVRL